MNFVYYLIIAICGAFLLSGIYGIFNPDKIKSKKNPDMKRKEKIIIGIFIVGVSAAGINWAWNGLSTNKPAATVQEVAKEKPSAPKPSDAEEEKKKQAMKELEKKQDGYIKIIMAATNLDKAAAENVYTAFQSVGIKDLKSMMYVDEKTKSYTWESGEIAKGAVGVINIQNGIVGKIIYKNVVLYEDGKAIKNVSGGVMSQQDYEVAESYAKKAVREYLKDADSAEFDEGHFYYAKNDNMIEVTGKVKAKNSFNAYVVNKFFVVVDLNKKTYNLKGFE